MPSILLHGFLATAVFSLRGSEVACLNLVVSEGGPFELAEADSRPLTRVKLLTLLPNSPNQPTINAYELTTVTYTLLLEPPTITVLSSVDTVLGGDNRIHT